MKCDAHSYVNFICARVYFSLNFRKREEKVGWSVKITDDYYNERGGVDGKKNVISLFL